MPEEKNINELQPEQLEGFLEDGLPPGCEEYPMIPLRGMMIFPYSGFGRSHAYRARDFFHDAERS